MSACSINPSRVTAVQPEQDYTKLGCDALKAESDRITADYVALRFSQHAGTRNKLARLNGETAAVNDSIRINGCPLASVRIPGSAWAEQNGHYASSQQQ